MDPSVPGRTTLFSGEPTPDLRGLASLTDPDDDVAAVIDLAVMGARGDGKTQFLVHAIRALHGRAPALAGGEQDLNRQIMRLVLDPRAPRPEATPPGVVPHFTFRVQAPVLFDRLAWRDALALARRLGRVGGLIALAGALIFAGLAIAPWAGAAAGVLAGATGALIGAAAALIARSRIARAGEIEIAFWDVAGEQVYAATAADYHALLGRLVDARRRRAERLGRAYAFAPILICNPIALGRPGEGSPYVRLRALLPLFAAIDRGAARAIVAINRWTVVDPICRRGARRDEIVAVTTHARGEPAGPPQEVARELVRVHCLDAEDGRDGHVAISYLRYDTAIDSRVEAAPDGALTYAYDDGPGTFSGDAHRRFLGWLVGLPRWAAPAPREVATATAIAARQVATATAPAARGATAPALRQTATATAPREATTATATAPALRQTATAPREAMTAAAHAPREATMAAAHAPREATTATATAPREATTATTAAHAPPPERTPAPSPELVPAPAAEIWARPGSR